MYYKRSILLGKNLINQFRACSTKPNLLRIETTNGVKTITMCDAKTRNSLSIAMMENLISQIRQEENTETRAIILSSDGPIFSAGHNLKELSIECGRQQIQKVFTVATELMSCIIESPLPILARVDGLAAAAGCQLVAQCDIAVCTENSHFSTPGANFGIFCSTPGVALARTVPKSTAMQMLLTGLPIDSREAKNSGLVTKVCKKEDLDKEINAICDAIKTKSRSVIALGKSFYYKQVLLDVRTAYQVGGNKMVENLMLVDGQEGIKSFIEKRQPIWQE